MDKKNIRILVVDDEETLCEGLRTYLELEGYTVDASLSADDYISKPYEIKNLLARIEAVLRRSSRHRMMTKGITCDRASLTCFVDGRTVKMPRKEFEILALLLENRGRVFTREELISRIWPDKVIVVDRAVDVHVARIRSKIAPYSRHIVARTGYGYGWED